MDFDEISVHFRNEEIKNLSIHAYTCTVCYIINIGGMNIT